MSEQQEARQPDPVKDWIEGFEERERKQIRFALLYEMHFAHGAPGHLDMMVIAKLARYIDMLTKTERTP